MNKILVLIIGLTMSSISIAGTINSDGSYKGKVLGVAVGFWGHVGVGLEGIKCNEKNEVLLLSNNDKYKDILAVLLAAEASGKSVIFYRVSHNTEQVDPAHTYCVITEAALGEFPRW